MNNSNQSILQRAISFIESHYAEPISVSAVAKEVFCSESGLMALFKKQTSEGIWARVLKLRIEKAKELLRETDLGVSEIALHVGFQSYTALSIAFKKNSGMSPSQYRSEAHRLQVTSKSRREPTSGKGESLFFQDNMDAAKIEPWWEIAEGEWRPQNGGLAGEGEEDATLRLLKNLPENFRISFEVSYISAKGLGPSDLTLVLFDGQFKDVYCRLTVGAYENTVGRSLHRNALEQWNPEAVLKTDGWQEVALELKDDTIRLFLDQKQMFGMRDPFPPPYPSRSRFALGTYRRYVCIRKFRIHDLGFSPVASTIRQGDALYNAGSFKEAHEFYMRRLESPGGAANAIELRYKIGLCILKQGNYSQARPWFEKVVTLPEKDLWAQYAKMALLEADLLDGRIEELLHDVKSLYGIVALRPGLRQVLQKAGADLTGRGFYDRAVDTHLVWLGAEENGTVSYFLALEALGNSLRLRNRFEDSKIQFRMIIDSPLPPRNIVLRALHQLSDVTACQGRFDESEKFLASIEERAAHAHDLARCSIYRAFNLRGAMRLQEAMDLLGQVVDRFPGARNFWPFVRLHLSLLQSLTGDGKSAKRTLADVRIAMPYPLSPLDLYLPDFLEQKYLDIAHALRGSFPQEGGLALEYRAHYLFVTALCFALGGKSDPFREILEHLTRRFPEKSCCFYRFASEGLLRNDEIDLEVFPYPNQRRSEIFFLLGTIHDLKGNSERAHHWWRLSLKEDPTLRWPAFLARQKLVPVQ